MIIVQINANLHIYPIFYLLSVSVFKVSVNLLPISSFSLPVLTQHSMPSEPCAMANILWLFSFLTSLDVLCYTQMVTTLRNWLHSDSDSNSDKTAAWHSVGFRLHHVKRHRMTSCTDSNEDEAKDEFKCVSMIILLRLLHQLFSNDLITHDC